MPKSLLLLIILNLPFFCSAQQNADKNIWHLTIVDSATSKGIDKATLSLNNKVYYTSDNNGVIAINKDQIQKKDSFIISCIGYRSVKIVASGNKYPDTVHLSADIISLKEVKIRAAKSVEMTVDKTTKKKVHDFQRVTDPESAYVQYIPNDKKIKGTVISVRYAINDVLHGIEMPFRVRLFTKMKDSITLDKELTTDSIIIYNPQRKTLINVDISKYNIQMPETGILVVFELMPRSYYGKDSTLWNGNKMVKTPGIDMVITNSYGSTDNGKINRETPYSMVGPSADSWNLERQSEWFIFTDGNNFKISITVDKDEATPDQKNE